MQLSRVLYNLVFFSLFFLFFFQSLSDLFSLIFKSPREMGCMAFPEFPSPTSVPRRGRRLKGGWDGGSVREKETTQRRVGGSGRKDLGGVGSRKGGEGAEGSTKEKASAQVTFPLPMTFIRRIFCLLLPVRHGFDMKRIRRVFIHDYFLDYDDRKTTPKRQR